MIRESFDDDKNRAVQVTTMINSYVQISSPSESLDSDSTRFDCF